MTEDNDKTKKQLKTKPKSQDDGSEAPEQVGSEDATKTKAVDTTWHDTSDTIFIRNLSYDTEEDDLKKFIEEGFGETRYCLVCRDKATDESKGTAFVKFKEVETAQKCLAEFKDYEQQIKFHLDGRNLMVLPALKRDEVDEIKGAQKKQEKKDIKKKKRQVIGKIQFENKNKFKSQHNRADARGKPSARQHQGRVSKDRQTPHKKISRPGKPGPRNHKAQPVQAGIAKKKRAPHGNQKRKHLHRKKQRQRAQQ